MSRSGIIGLVFLIAPILHAQESVSCKSGMASFQFGNFSAAQDFLWDCIESRAGNENHAFYLALTYRPLKNYASGLTRANRLLKELPNNVDLLYIAAYLHYRQNEIKDSMVLTSKAYDLAPKDWRIQQLFALNYISFNMLEAAKLSLQQAIALKPDNAELEYQLARLYFTQGNYVASIETSKKALAILPDYPEVYITTWRYPMRAPATWNRQKRVLKKPSNSAKSRTSGTNGRWLTLQITSGCLDIRRQASSCLARLSISIQILPKPIMKWANYWPTCRTTTKPGSTLKSL